MSLKDRLKKASKTAAESLWTGPSGDGPNGGVTQSMIGSWLVCRERFRVQYVLGLQPPDEFNHRIEYGSMFHVCIEAHDGPKPRLWAEDLATYCKQLCRVYPLQQSQIVHWMNVCKAQFPVYVEHWQKHKDKSGEVHTPLLQEQAFDVPYKLPSGRTVRLRGKWDGVELIEQVMDVRGTAGPKGKTSGPHGRICIPGVWLDENKTKGDVDENLLRRQLKMDLQTMLYLVALQSSLPPQKDLTFKNLFDGSTMIYGKTPPPLMGIRYNVIRRPLSGGKGSIRKYQPTKSNPQGESDAAFYARLQGIIGEEPGYWFMRWTSEVSLQDIERFKTQFLNPACDNMLDDSEWWSWCLANRHDHFDYIKRADVFSNHKNRAYRLPYGVYSPLLDGRPSDLDAYLDDGSLGSLRRANRLFKELSND